MASELKFIAKPIQINMCMLIHAMITNNLEDLAKNSHYIIEDSDGEQHEIYARNDELFYEKIVKNKYKDVYNPTNPTYF